MLNDKLPHQLVVRGRDKVWAFRVYAKREHAEQWRADGLCVHEVINTVPVWVANIGLTKVWCVLQDLVNFRWPW